MAYADNFTNKTTGERIDIQDTSAQDSLATLQTAVSTAQTDISNNADDIDSLNTSLTNISSEVTQLNSDIANVNSRFGGTYIEILSWSSGSPTTVDMSGYNTFAIILDRYEVISVMVYSSTTSLSVEKVVTHSGYGSTITTSGMTLTLDSSYSHRAIIIHN